MGWLFACFGCTKKRKRPKKASNFGPKSRRIRGYQPLEQDVTQEPNVSEPLSSSNLEIREEAKEEKRARNRKKVRFNLEVIAYEPIPADDAGCNSEEDDIYRSWEEIEEQDDEQAAAKVCLVYAPLSESSYSSNHRYNNCYDEDEDDAECEPSDLDEEDEDDDDSSDDCLVDLRNVYHEEIPEEYQNYCVTRISSGNEDQRTTTVSTSNTRFRSHYIVPVLNPIENLSQLKALKARKC